MFKIFYNDINSKMWYHGDNLQFLTSNLNKPFLHFEQNVYYKLIQL